MGGRKGGADPECRVPGGSLYRGQDLRTAIPHPSRPLEALIVLGLDEVATESDVGVHVITVDGILTLALEEPCPDAVTGRQGQHHALALHDAAVTGLCIQDDGCLLVVHDVHVSLLEVPAVHVEAEEVEAAERRNKVAGSQVKVPIQVHEDRVEEQWLEALAAVQGRFAAH